MKFNSFMDITFKLLLEITLLYCPIEQSSVFPRNWVKSWKTKTQIQLTKSIGCLIYYCIDFSCRYQFNKDDLRFHIYFSTNISFSSLPKCINIKNYRILHITYWLHLTYWIWIQWKIFFSHPRHKFDSLPIFQFPRNFCCI